MKRRVPPHELVTTEARIRGANRRRSGDRLERLLEHQLIHLRRLTWHESRAEYRLARADDPPVAVISRVHPRVAGVPGRMRITEKATVDFVGQVRRPAVIAQLFEAGTRAALPIAFDAKSVTGGHASFKVDPDQRHQLAFLLDWRAGGGMAGYFLEDARERRCWWLAGAHLDTLACGQGVKFRSLATAVAGARPHTVANLLPSVPWSVLPGTGLQGYDWIPLLWGVGA